MLTERGSWLKVIEGKRGFTIGLRALLLLRNENDSLQSHLRQLYCCDLVQTASASLHEMRHCV